MDLRQLTFNVLTIVVVAWTAYSQSDTIVDVMPLSVGNQWTYRFNASWWDNSGYTETDSGLATYSIVANILGADSNRWIFEERRNLRRCIDYYFNNLPDTCWSIMDTTTFEVVEVKVGRHRLYRNQSEDQIWNSVFPWLSDFVDTVAIYRYSSVDSLDFKEIQSHSASQTYNCVYNFIFRKGVGQIRVAAETSPYILGVGYRSDHQLLSWIITSLPDDHNVYVPTSFSLSQNYPNPFNPATTISFSLPTKSFVSLKVFDALGREVETLVSEQLDAGTYSTQWNPVSLPSGVYFYRLQAGSFIETKKLILLR